MHLVERQTKRGSKTKARPSWTAYGTGSWMTWSRYRKKWSWYFINIAPRWEALKLDRATMSNRWSRCLKPTTVKTVRWWNEAERVFPVLLSSLRSIEKREHQSFCLSATIKKRQTCGGQKKRSIRNLFPPFASVRLNTSQINVDDVKYSQSVRSSISRDIFEAISENSEIKMRRSIQVLPLLLLLYHSKPHETIIDHYRCIYIEILREIRHFTILISESDRINFKSSHEFLAKFVIVNRFAVRRWAYSTTIGARRVYW